MKTTLFLVVAAFSFAIPGLASAETAVIEATITRAGKRAPIAALTLDVAADGSATEADISNPGGSCEVEISRAPKAGRSGATRLRFRIDINRGRDGRFKLRSSGAFKPNVRTVVGAYRQANGDHLELAVTLAP